MIKITNRHGVVEPLDIGKIKEKINLAFNTEIYIDSYKNLNSIKNVLNVSSLESGIDIIYKDTTTINIQKTLIEHAKQLANEDEPYWVYIAGRLYAMELKKEIEFNRGFDFGELHLLLSKYDDIYDTKYMFKNYTLEEIKFFEDILKSNKRNDVILNDFIYDIAGINMLADRYLINKDGKKIEMIQEMYMIISLFINAKENKKNRTDLVLQTYNALSNLQLSLATPILLNLRKKDANLSSCFITAIDDNIESIYYNYDTVAKISKNAGGVGINISRLRAKGSSVGGQPNASNPVTSWIKMINDTIVSVNQQGKRAGAATVALDIWHLDIEDFLEIQVETGDTRNKSFDIFPQLIIPDLFMQRVKSNEKWTLFCPYEIEKKTGIKLYELYGREFENAYKTLEKSSIIRKKEIDSVELFSHIMKTQIETGMPFIAFKDTMNILNGNKSTGYIGNANLCMESYSNFRPSIIKEDRLMAGTDIMYRKVELGRVHVCNLASINLANIEIDDIEHIANIATRFLDNSIDLTNSPIIEGRLHNEDYRTIGIGTMGLADYLAKHQIGYNHKNTYNLVNYIFELIALKSFKASAIIASEKGAYKLYDKSEYAKGIFFNKTKEDILNNTELKREWNEVFDMVERYGLRNGELTAIAPNTSTSIIQGSTASIIPVFKRFYVEKNGKGSMPRTAKYAYDDYWFYTEFKKLKHEQYIKIMAIASQWTTQGVSSELIFDLNDEDIDATYIMKTIFDCWKAGLKTIYYIRFIQKANNTLTEKDECVSCSG